jgi:hypothetical protein
MPLSAYKKDSELIALKKYTNKFMLWQVTINLYKEGEIEQSRKGLVEMEAVEMSWKIC